MLFVWLIMLLICLQVLADRFRVAYSNDKPTALVSETPWLSTNLETNTGSILVGLPFTVALNKKYYSKMRVYPNSKVVFGFSKNNPDDQTQQESMVVVSSALMVQTVLNVSVDSSTVRIHYEGYYPDSPTPSNMSWELSFFKQAPPGAPAFQFIMLATDVSLSLSPRFCENSTSCPVNFSAGLNTLAKIYDCGQGCLECSPIKFTCQLCRPGYALDSTGSCVQCSSDCLACSVSSQGQTTCKTCNVSTKLQEGKCVQASETLDSGSPSSGLSTLVIVAICLSVSVTLGLIACFLCWRRFKSKPQSCPSNFSQAKSPLHDEVQVSVRKTGQTSYEITQKRSASKLERLEVADVKCAICLQAQSLDFMSSCRHFFHSSCVLNWYAKKAFCPMCRSQDVGFLLLCVACGHSLTRQFHACTSTECKAYQHTLCYQKYMENREACKCTGKQEGCLSSQAILV